MLVCHSHVPLEILIVEGVGAAAAAPRSGELHRDGARLRRRRRRLDGGGGAVGDGGTGMAVGLDGDEARVGRHGEADERLRSGDAEMAHVWKISPPYKLHSLIVESVECE